MQHNANVRVYRVKKKRSFSLNRSVFKVPARQQRNNKISFSLPIILYVVYGFFFIQYELQCEAQEKHLEFVSEYNDEIGKCVRLKPKIISVCIAMDARAHFLYKKNWFSRKGFFHLISLRFVLHTWNLARFFYPIRFCTVFVSRSFVCSSVRLDWSKNQPILTNRQTNKWTKKVSLRPIYQRDIYYVLCFFGYHSCLIITKNMISCVASDCSVCAFKFKWWWRRSRPGSSSSSNNSSCT